MSRLDELKERANAEQAAYEAIGERIEKLGDALFNIESELSEVYEEQALTWGRFIKAGQELTKEKERLGTDE